MSIEIGKQIRYNGKYITAPDHYASNVRRLSRLAKSSDCLILLASPLFADGLLEYIQSSNTQALFVCIDFEPALEELLLKKASVLTKFRVQVLQCGSENDIKTQLDAILPKEGIQQVFLQALSGGFSLHRERYYSVLEHCKKTIFNTKKNKLTLRYFTRRWIKNIFANIIKPPAWSQIHIDKPVFLLGAGPSLEPWLAFLQEHRTKIFLLVVDSVLPTLAAVNIRPDLIIAQDAQLVNCADLIPLHWKSTPVLADLIAHPSIARQLPTSYFISTFAPLALLDAIQHAGVPCIPNLGSVGISAYYLIRRYYQGELFLVGMDMYYEVGKSHVSMSAGHRHSLATAKRLTQGGILQMHYNRRRVDAHDKDGNACTVDVVLQGYAEIFSLLLQSDRKIWDLGANGLSIGAKRWKEGDIAVYLDALKQVCYTISIEGYKNPIAFITHEINTIEAFLSTEDRDEQEDFFAGERSYILDGEQHERYKGYGRISAIDYLSCLKRKLLVLSRLEH